eukprot:TCONS_00061609-protein
MECIPDRLYFCLSTYILENYQEKPGDLVINLDEVYQHAKVRKHFGPPSLKIVWKHCDEIDSKLKKFKRIIFITNNLNDNLHIEQRTLSAFLMAAYAILRLEWNAEKVNTTLLSAIPARLAFFRDYHGESSYKLNIMDCLQGIHTGCIVNRWFTNLHQTKFPISTNSHLDMNWIIPGILLAFKDPTLNRTKETRSVSKAYIKELKRCGIKVIIRLNSSDHTANYEYYGKSYHPSDFKREQFYHYDIPFRDVGTPTTAQAHQFVSLCERYGSGIAVHCHAGLGRTATMIGSYMLKHFNFNARAVCGWLKVCRRGSVMGPQHFFLDKYQAELENIKRNMVVEGEKLGCETPTKQVSQQPITAAIKTELTRSPRKNNIIHIAPVNPRQLMIRPEQTMKKYKLDTTNTQPEKAENIRSKVVVSKTKPTSSEKQIVAPSRPYSTKPCLIKSSKSILHPKLTKSRESATVIAGAKSSKTQVTRELTKSVRKSARHDGPPAPRLRYTTTPNRKSQTKIEPVKSQLSELGTMLKQYRKNGSQEAMGRKQSSKTVIHHGGKRATPRWHNNIPSDGFMSQNKGRIYGLINTVYSKQNKN